MISPVESWMNVRSPIRATVDAAPPASAAPIAVELVPSIPATPRFDSTRTPSDTRPASATSRIGLLAPTTN
ncbi:Uncharacterised protein [Mycobacteroides abscessus subsp. abscessus]|nr:Uncharacterised protein [Mycobacteroides abscessus subsp. abscessus]